MLIPAEPEDADQISELVNSAYRGDSSRQGWTTEADLIGGTRTASSAIRELLSHAETRILKYIEGTELLGCVELMTKGEQLYLGMLTVSPGRQGRGIGKILLAGAEEEARRQGCSSIFMTVISVRQELIDWYFRHGYSDTGERKPFQVPDERWGIPKQKLEFVVLEKKIQK